MAAAEAPWHVEVLTSQLKYVEGPSETILKRIEKATKCQLEVNRRKGKKKALKAISYGGQTQYLDDDGDQDDSKTPVKIFIRGGPESRITCAELIRNVAEGEDVEILCARAAGAITFEHDIVHPDRVAWARWRLLLVAHEHGARGHIGKNTVCLSAKSGGELDREVAEKVEAAAEAVIVEAQKLVELVVDGRDEYEPEDAPSDPAVAPFVDQYGVIVRVSDQDDNVVSDIIKIRLVGPADATNDVASILRARFVEGKSTAAVLQSLGQVQGMPAQTAGDFANDLKEFTAECGVLVHQTKTALWISGPDNEVVAEAKTTLQEMLQFYLGPAACLLMQGLQPAAINQLLEDQDIGGLMTKPDCVVAFDDGARTAWICGKHNSAVKFRIEEIIRLSNGTAPEETDGEPPAKKRRTNALTVHSGASGF